MFFNNLFYFLVVIFVLSTNSAPESPRISPAIALPLTLLLFSFYSYFCNRIFGRVQNGSASAYFKAERTLSIVAVGMFVFIFYFFDLKYYLHPLSIGDRLPVLENIGGICFFAGFLMVMWARARRYYQAVFQRSYSIAKFVAANSKINLPIILPWLVLSLFFDLLSLFDIPFVNKVLATYWGDLILFVIFVLFLLFFFPPLVRWLWNCKPMPQGPLRSEIEFFFRKQHFFSDILIWPLFEGQVITAGVMGVIPGLRYVLVTPALLQTMNWSELEAVLAHEIGHVKKKHILLYLVLFLGFSILAGAAVEPLPYLILSSDLFYAFPAWIKIAPDVLLAVLVAAPFLIFMLVYFRFIFGYFIRNFERQADLHVFKVQNESTPLINSFEKIALLSGNTREQKNWHHFGIGERITFLEQCEQNRSLISKHDRKVNFSLIVYFLLITVSVGMLRQVDFEKLAAGNEARYIEAVVMHKLYQEPDNSLWLLLLGDLMQERKMEEKAIDAYEKALQLDPVNADIHNNLAWLLLTAQNSSLLDPSRALVLAGRAAELKQKGYIYDTLAVALWANGRVDDAVAVEMRAIEIDPDNKEFYLNQLKMIKNRK